MCNHVTTSSSIGPPGCGSHSTLQWESTHVPAPSSWDSAPRLQSSTTLQLPLLRKTGGPQGFFAVLSRVGCSDDRILRPAPTCLGRPVSPPVGGTELFRLVACQNQPFKTTRPSFIGAEEEEDHIGELLSILRCQSYGCLARPVRQMTSSAVAKPRGDGSRTIKPLAQIGIWITM